jgi:hypothetical protein
MGLTASTNGWCPWRNDADDVVTLNKPTGEFMSQRLALGLMLLGTVAVGRAQPPNAGMDKAVARDAKVQALQEVERRRALQEFERLVFQPDGDASGAHRRLESQLAMHIQDLDQACGLSDPQKKKLQLAGRGDIRRFFDRYQAVVQKVQAMNNPAQNIQDVWQDIGPLQMILQAGLFHEDSLFVKSLPNTLTGEQFARYDEMARERRASRHRESIETAIAILQRGIRLRDAQRRELISLITKQTKPSRRPSPYDAYVVLLQLGRLPDEKLKRLFDEKQWQRVHEQLAQCHQLEPMLKQAGQLPAEDDGHDSSDEDRSP